MNFKNIRSDLATESLEQLEIGKHYNKEEYDLILSGHYHGGQIRIPFYGALFIPHINGGKIFPQQDEVSGLKDYGLFKQYTSKGLGSNFYFKLFQFRIFNTPEINVIKLTSAKSN